MWLRAAVAVGGSTGSGVGVALTFTNKYCPADINPPWGVVVNHLTVCVRVDLLALLSYIGGS